MTGHFREVFKYVSVAGPVRLPLYAGLGHLRQSRGGLQRKTLLAYNI